MAKGKPKKQKSTKHVFVLSDGTPLVYALVRDKGSQYPTNETNWFRTNDHADLRKSYKNKRRQPKLGLWSGWITKHNQLEAGSYPVSIDSPELILCAADFDNLPNGLLDFDSLEKHLKHNYPDSIVIRTASGKVKALFQIEVINPKADHTEACRTALKSILANFLYEAIDLTKPALSIVFVTPENVTKIANELPNLTTAWRAEPTLDDFALCGTDNPDLSNVTYLDDHREASDTPIVFFEGSMHDSLKGQCTTELSEKFMRALLANKRLIRGTQLSQGYYAKHLGVNRATISKLIKRFREASLLELKSPTYKPGVCAKVYYATGFLREALEVIHSRAALVPPLAMADESPASATSRGVVCNLLCATDSESNEADVLPLQTDHDSPPLTIKDGQWLKTHYAVAMKFFFYDPEGYLAWAYSLPGWRDKDRPRLIEGIVSDIRDHTLKRSKRVI